MKRCRLIVLFSSIGLTAFAALTAEVQYVLTDLGTLGGDFAYVSGINNRGEIVGNSTTHGSTVMHAFIYSNGRLTDLGTLGGTNSYGYGINDWGVAVGAAHLSNGQSHGFVYTNGVMSDLGTLGGTGSDARAINNSGQIAGGAWTGSDTALHAYLLSGGIMNDLGTLGGARSTAYGLNGHGDVVGASWPSGSTIWHAFLYRNGGMQDLGTLGGTSPYSYAYAINENDLVVGKTSAIGGPEEAFLYDDGAMNDLGSLGRAGSIARGINSGGQVVGEASVTNGIGTAAFIYSGGVMSDLNTLIPPDSGWILEVATGINDRGQIIGIGMHPAGQVRAFLLTPVPVLQISLTGSNTVIQFTGQANTGYVVEHRSSLSSGAWEAMVVLDPVSIIHTVALSDQLSPGSPARFYRVRVN